jgi:hypothetical protein
MFEPILLLHIAAGSVALASMLVPIVSRKGGSVHRRAGWVFVAAMAVVSSTALVLSASRLLFDPRPQARGAGLFLFCVSLLTGNAVSSGMRVLRFKNRTSPHVHWWDTGLPAALGVASAGLGVYAFVEWQALYAAFAAIGALSAAGSLRDWLRAPSSPMHWWFGHMNGMLGGCVAAVTAFLVTNGDGLDLWRLAAWLGPSIVGTPATAIWTAHYRRKFGISGRESRRGTSGAAPSMVPGTPARIR